MGKKFDNLTCDFVCTSSVKATFVVEEYAGMTVPQITDAIQTTLSEIAPGVNFFEQDVAEAAVKLHEACGG